MNHRVLGLMAIAIKRPEILAKAMNQWNQECEDAVKALIACQLKPEDARRMVVALHVLHPQAQAADLAMMVLDHLAQSPSNNRKDLRRAAYDIAQGATIGHLAGDAKATLVLIAIVGIIVLIGAAALGIRL